MAVSSNTTTAVTTETPSTNLSSISTTNSSSLFSSPISITTKGSTNNNNKYFWSPTGHTIESSLSPKDIVIQLRQLAQDPHQQIHLINNTDSLRILCDTLLETTTRSSIETCIISLQTLQLLATNPNYRQTLQSVPKLLQRIDNLCISKQQRVQSVAKNLQETITSKITSNIFQQYTPRPLHKIELTVINLNNEKDRDEIQTIAIKINGIISVTINMSSRECVFYTHRENVKNILIQSLRSNGFQVQTEEEKDFDDVASMHSGISNFTDINNNKAQLSSLLINKHDKNIPFTNQFNPANSIIQERYNSNNNSLNNSLITVNGPSYPTPQQFSRTGITKYKAQQEVMSLQQRLEHEQQLKHEEEKKQRKTQSFLAKVVSYIW
eukprot:485374_1